MGQVTKSLLTLTAIGVLSIFVLAGCAQSSKSTDQSNHQNRSSDDPYQDNPVQYNPPSGSVAGD